MMPPLGHWKPGTGRSFESMPPTSRQGIPFGSTRPSSISFAQTFQASGLPEAVGASSALPMVFPPITVQNYGGTCGFEKPAWLDESLKNARVSVPRQWRYARVLESYLAQVNRPYIHLIDGGISDNLGVRNPWRMAMDIEHWNNIDQDGTR